MTMSGGGKQAETLVGLRSFGQAASSARRTTYPGRGLRRPTEDSRDLVTLHE
jgi:hypothetical protein